MNDGPNPDGADGESSAAADRRWWLARRRLPRTPGAGPRRRRSTVTPRPATYDADYIVVGSGAGGGTVAARLAEAGFQVLLLEAGGDPRTSIGGDAADARRQHVCRTTTTCPPSMRCRPRTTACAGTSSSATSTIDGDSRRAIRSSRRDVERPAGERRALPARRHARRLHGAQRDDPRLPAQRRLEPDRRSHRRPVVARRDACARYFERLEHCDHRPDERALEPAGREPEPARLVRLAAHREGDARRGDPRPRSSHHDPRVGASRPAAAPSWRSPTPIDARGSTAHSIPTTGAWSPTTPSVCATRR